jgi:cell division protease FtsH
MLKLILLLLLSQTSKCLFISSIFTRHNLARKCFVDDDIMDGFEDDNDEKFGIIVPYNDNNSFYKSYSKSLKKSLIKKNIKSENFEVVNDHEINFNKIGGYYNIKNELLFTCNVLTNPKKYKKYDIRTPKGLILEGPPGNGKTLLAKGLCGTLNISFIQASSSIFQEKYVGVGASRVRELFDLANQNKPCIIFLDEIDSLGRTRSSKADGGSQERDSTLNELLVQMDGFKNNNEIFIIMATNRVDLLDQALIRPGRIDKKIFIDNPDKDTRREILSINLINKPLDYNIQLEYLVELTAGFSCAQIENLINEVMLHVLFQDRELITIEDIDIVYNKILTGYQDKKIIYSDKMIERIIIHEIGHGVSGLFCKHNSQFSKIRINLNSPKSPGITIFELNEIDSNILTYDILFNNLVILLSGKTAEEIFLNNSLSTGASKDLEEAYKLAHKMVLQYGMSEKLFSSINSDIVKYQLDNEIEKIIKNAVEESRKILKKNLSKNKLKQIIQIIKKNNGIDRNEFNNFFNQL